MTSRRRKKSIKFCDSIGLEVATLRPNIGLKVATLRPMFRFGKVTHTYLASTSPGLNVAWPQRRLASLSLASTSWPQSRLASMSHRAPDDVNMHFTCRPSRWSCHLVISANCARSAHQVRIRAFNA